MSYIPIPSGSLQAFAGASAPNGWLLCDGSAVSRTVYAALFANISTLWGVGDGSTTFNLPDLRGAFVRGVGTSGVHVGPATVGSVQTHATAKNGLTASSGSMSANAVHGHTDTGHSHGIPNGINDAPPWNVVQRANTLGGQYGGTSDAAANITSTNTDHSHAITIAAGDSETRPNSRGVQYIIKI